MNLNKSTLFTVLMEEFDKGDLRHKVCTSLTDFEAYLNKILLRREVNI